MNSIQKAGIHFLPKELIQYAFSFLDLANLAEVMSVCKLWNELANENVMWSSFASRISDGACLSKESLKLKTHEYVIALHRFAGSLNQYAQHSQATPPFSDSVIAPDPSKLLLIAGPGGYGDTECIGPYKVSFRSNQTVIQSNINSQIKKTIPQNTYIGIWRKDYLITQESSSIFQVTDLRYVGHPCEKDKQYRLKIFATDSDLLPEGTFSLHEDVILFTPKDTDKKCLGYSLKTETILFNKVSTLDGTQAQFVHEGSGRVAIATQSEISLFNFQGSKLATIDFAKHCDKKIGPIKTVLETRIIDNCVVAVVQGRIHTQAKMVVWELTGNQIAQLGMYKLDNDIDEDDIMMNENSDFSYCFIENVFVYRDPDNTGDMNDMITFIDIKTCTKIGQTEGIGQKTAFDNGFSKPYFNTRGLGYYTDFGTHVVLTLQEDKMSKVESSLNREDTKTQSLDEDQSPRRGGVKRQSDTALSDRP